MEWIASNTSQDALIMASPQMGLYIPAYTGRRVLYGHPFETLNATDMESVVVNFLTGRINLEGLPLSRKVDLIFHGIQATVAFIDKKPARDTRYPLSPNANPPMIWAKLPSRNCRISKAIPSDAQARCRTTMTAWNQAIADIPPRT